MGGLPKGLAKTFFMNHLLILLCLTLTGCCSSNRIMSAENLRAALDECKELKLWTLVYQRADRSVMDIRCIPDPANVNEIITLRPKMPMKLIRPFYESDPVPKGYYEQQQ